MSSLISISDLTKNYDGGFTALKGVNLDVKKGEILALLGPNGAGKTTMIAIICGIVNPTSGRVTVGGYDIVADYRSAQMQPIWKKCSGRCRCGISETMKCGRCREA